MSSLLYLDLATNLGWACGDCLDRPVFGSHALPKTGPDLGTYGLAYLAWLRPKLDLHEPKRIAFEQPFLSESKLNLSTVRKLTGLCTLTEIEAKERGIPVSETNYSTVRMFALGHGKRTGKDPMIAQAIRRGYEVSNHNEADAVLGWLTSCKVLWPDQTEHIQSFKDWREPELL